MAIIDYTTYDEIRATLGVATDELPDSVLVGDTMWYMLKDGFTDISVNLLADFATISAKPTPTAGETAFIEFTHIFATLFVSNQLLDSLPMFAPKSIIEEKSDVTRFSSSPYIRTSESVAKSYIKFRKKLVNSYSALSGGTKTTATQLPYIGVVTPVYDPVTGA